MQVTDILGIKIQNIQSIIRAVRFEDRITKRMITEKTGLSFATVSNLCNELVERNVLLAAKDIGLSVGRTPQTFSFAYNHYCVLCINLQLQGVMDLALLNFRNEVLLQKTYQYEPQMNPEDIIAFAHRCYIQDMAHDSSVEIIGIGVAVSSIYDIHSKKLICCAIEQFEDVDMKAVVEQEFGIQAYVDNEANLCARAVVAQGSGNENVVYLHASEGVGVGIICHGKLLQGENGFAGEVAHMPIGSSDRRCKTCGCNGCIETYLSIDGLLYSYFGENTRERFEKWKAYLDALTHRDPQALEAARRSGTQLGKLVSVLLNLFDPESLYIGGDIAVVYPYLRESMEKEVERRCSLWLHSQARIICDEKSEHQINVGISERICSSWCPV